MVESSCRVRFSFGDPDRPFLISVAPYGGAAFMVALDLQPDTSADDAEALASLLSRHLANVRIVEPDATSPGG